MKYIQKTIPLLTVIAKVRLRYYLAGALVLCMICYGVLFVMRQPVVFSYAGDSCVPRLTLLPGIHRSSEDVFAVQLRGGLSGIYATQACVNPVSHPRQGSSEAAIAPWGGWLFRQHFRIQVPRAPEVNVTTLHRPISTTRMLTLPLSRADTTFSYALQFSQQQAQCSAKHTILQCDVANLKLTQGREYPVQLVRTFMNTRTTLASHPVKTLSAVAVSESSIRQDETVYAKPREITLHMTKPLEKATAMLVKLSDTAQQEIPIRSTHATDAIRISLDADLERDQRYELRITEARATDGSGLDGVVAIPFRTSGGPKPTGVTPTGQSVDPASTVMITFDQELSATQDIAKLLQVTGAQVEVARTAHQLQLRLLNAPRCADITIALAPGVLSRYDVPSALGWKHSFRTACRTTTTIGYSKQGRPIQAQYFGNGNETILFVGGIHGNEKSSSLILQDLAADLDTRARSIPASRQVVIVPTLNPDGYAANTRNNAANVNLNRNFATSDWVQDLQDTGGGVKGGGGSAPMSEPETKAIATLSQRVQPRFVVSYHAVGSVVIGNLSRDSSSRAASYASSVGYSNGTGRDAEIFDYAITGTYDDWLAQKLGVPSMIVELGSYTYRDYSHHRAAMWGVITN